MLNAVSVAAALQGCRLVPTHKQLCWTLLLSFCLLGWVQCDKVVNPEDREGCLSGKLQPPTTAAAVRADQAACPEAARNAAGLQQQVGATRRQSQQDRHHQ
jgi:hypothetical protein